jgi:transposase
MPKFVQRHQSQLYLLPPDLRDWLPEDDLAHFVVEAVERVPLERFQVNERGTGSAQYHPRMMLALLVYCYANGIFGSRRIERATYRDIGVRYVAANCHPDHDTICTFRRSNFDAVAEAFLQVLLLAKELQLLRVGTVSVDGTKVDANANKRNSIRYDRAGALREQLRGEIEGLLDQAEHADTDDAPDPQGLPEELSRRDKLRAKLDRACAELERRAQARADSERAEYERKVAARARRTGSRKGRHIKPPTEAPEAKAQINLTDADSALMRKSRHHEYRQAYNAQAAVDSEARIIVATTVSNNASDTGQLTPTLDELNKNLSESPDRVLADAGYRSESNLRMLERREIDGYVPMGREKDIDTAPLPPKSTAMGRMIRKMKTQRGRDRYRARKHIGEPPFGWIKSVLGFRQFSLRGLDNVTCEWNLVALAVNLRRMNGKIEWA